MYEERQIAKVAMITSKEVRERLYAMLKAGLVQLQEVPKSADHTPSRTIFLWSIPERANHLHPFRSGIFRSFASRLCSALVNLRDLSALERRKHAQLLEKVERSDVASNLDLLSAAEQKQISDLKKVLTVLNVKADAIFNEFLLFRELSSR
jgi:DNA-directed RNA polymerase III subunit RPC3